MRRRLILEMGMGNSLHKGDYTQAAMRAVEDGIRHASLGFTDALGIDFSELEISITVGVTKPEQVDIEAMRRVLPHGGAEVRVVQGGLDIPDEGLGDTAVIASAAIEVFLS